MFQQTPQKRVLFSRTLALATVGVLSVITILAANLFGGFVFGTQKVLAANATNNTLNFQARLENATGSIVPDGNYNVQFKLYDGDTSGGSAGKGAGFAGTNLWTETWQNSNSQGVRVVNGYLSVSLGSITSFPSTINWDQGLWLTMNIGGTSTGASPTYDGEMLGSGNTRLKVTGVPYALRAGSLAAYNSTSDLTSTLSLLQPTVGNQTFQIADQGAAGTYTICVQSGATASGGCAPTTGGTGYIQNQIASSQTTANFWISGTGRADTALQAPSIDSGNAGTAVTIGAGTSNGVVIGATTGTATVTVGQSSGSYTLALGNAQIATGNTETINIGTSATGTGKTVITVGSSNGASSLKLQAGTGNFSIIGATATTYTVGSTTGTGAITIGQSTATNTINIGNGATASGNTQTVNIATSAATGGNNVVAIGSTKGASSLTLQAGTGGASIASSGSNISLSSTGSAANINLATANANASVIVQSTGSSQTAFQIQNAVAAPLMIADSSTNYSYLADPGFELAPGGTFTDWTASGTPTSFTKSNTPANTFEGINSLHLVTGGSNQGFQTSAFSSSPTTVGTYIFSFYAMMNSSTMTSDQFTVTSTDGAPHSSTCNAGVTLNTSGFQRVVCSVTTTGTMTNIAVTSNIATAKNVFIDGASLVLTTNTAYSANGGVMLLGAVNSAATFRAYSNSTSAFQIQDATGTSNLFVADTLNNQINIGGTLNVTGAITGSSTITGTTLNGTTGINTGSGAGTQRIDSSGNLVNIGNTTMSGNLQQTGSGATNYMSGVLGLGTTSPQTSANGSILTIANGKWISAVDAAGTGYVNMFQVNSSNQIQVGAALNVDGGIVLPTDGGRLILVDEGFSSGISAGTPNSYTFGIGQANALTIYGENDGSGNAQNVRVAVGSSILPVYTLDVGGDINTSGVYRIGGTQICSSTGCTAASGSTYYIQNQNASTQTTANFWVSGSGRADGGFITSSLDTAAAGALTLGATHATSIALQQNVTVAANETFYIGATPGNATQVFIQSGASGNRGLEIQGATGQSADLLDLNDGNGVFVAGFNASGGLYLNGAATLGTNSSAGNILLHDGTSNGYEVTLQATSQLGNVTYQFGGSVAAGTYQICTTAAATCAGTYIQNQNASAQTTANFWISGSGQADTSLLSPSFDVAAAGTLSIGTSTNASVIQIGNSTSNMSQTITIGSNGTSGSSTAVTIGSLIGASPTTIQGGSGNINFVTNQSGAGTTVQSTVNAINAFSILNSANQSVFTVDTTNTVNLLTSSGFETSATFWSGFGTGASAGRTNVKGKVYAGAGALAVTLGSGSGTGAKVVGSAMTTNPEPAATYTFSFYAMGDATINGLAVAFNGGGTCTLNSTTISTAGYQRYYCTVTTTSTTNQITITATTTSQTFYIDNVQLQSGSTVTTYNIGTVHITGVVGSPLMIQNIDDSTNAFQIQNSTGTVFFSADTLNKQITLGVNTTLKPGSDGTSVFQVQNSNAISQLSVDTTLATPHIYIGPSAGDTVGTELVVGDKTNSGDPTGTNGAIYYNAGGTGGNGKFRCYENGQWQDCIGMRNILERRWGYVSVPGIGAGVTTFATDGTLTGLSASATTFTNDAQAESAYIDFTTSTAGNNDAGFNTTIQGTSTEARYLPKISTRIRSDPSAVANSRFYFQLSSGNLTTSNPATTSNGSSVVHMGIGLGTGGNFVCGSGDGSTESGTLMGISWAAGHYYDLVVDYSGGTLVCSVATDGGAFVSSTWSTNNPGTTNSTPLALYEVIRATTTTAKTFSVNYTYMESN